MLKHLNPMPLVSHNTPRKTNNHSAAAFPKKAGLLLVCYRNLWHLCSGFTVTLKKHCANSCYRSPPMKFCSPICQWCTTIFHSLESRDIMPIGSLTTTFRDQRKWVDRVRGSSKISVSGSNYIPRSCYLAK